MPKLARDADPDDGFRRELVVLIPFMRALARGYLRGSADADDLVQDVLLSAWRKRESFTPGTNMRAWISVILRNAFLLRMRNAWRTQALDPEVAERTLMAADDPAAVLELEDVRQALFSLPVAHREVLMMSAGGFAYEEIAAICGCPVGTVKSRVSRARAALAKALESGAFDHEPAPAEQAGDAIIAEIQALGRR